LIGRSSRQSEEQRHRSSLHTQLTAILKHLRIAVTALSLTVCVLLVALWVRSYWYVDKAWVQVTPYVTVYIEITPGQFTFFSVSSIVALPPGDWEKFTFPVDQFFGEDNPHPSTPIVGKLSLSDGYLLIPAWLLVLLTASIAAAPWIKWSKRFSLRTLLIATALFAIGLGAVIDLAR
jgi:hypothetical protein